MWLSLPRYFTSCRIKHDLIRYFMKLISNSRNNLGSEGSERILRPKHLGIVAHYPQVYTFGIFPGHSRPQPCSTSPRQLPRGSEPHKQSCPAEQTSHGLCAVGTTVAQHRHLRSRLSIGQEASQTGKIFSGACFIGIVGSIQNVII